MTGLEAAGDAMTGAVLGRAIEPGHGENTHEPPKNCANCGTALTGPYCHACGQMAHLHRTLGGIGHEILHGVFHFEGKIWRTLPLLVFKPGDLTRRYIHGERARFVSPMALFLFSVFLMFAVVSAIAGEMHAPEVPKELRGKSFNELQNEQARLKTEQKALRTQIDAGKAAGKDVKALQARYEKNAADRTDVATASAFVKGDGPTVTNLETGIPLIDAGLKKANDNPNLLIYKLQSSAYKYSWALIPLSTPFLWLLFFWRRDLKMYDHAIFITYSLAFMSLLVVTLTVLGALGTPSAIIALSATFIPPLHMYKQLKYAYLSGRVGALTRTFLLLNFALIALIFFALGLLAVGVLG
ncbi:MAG TPA: DUF3667 domain-containing protein [Sphingomonas sp.]|jgi:ribosomal protein L29|nr:DUF3667 domain-containing protein [Sphingomonas sp.]